MNIFEQYFLAILVLLVSLVIGLAIRQTLRYLLKKWAERTETKLDDVIINAVKNPIIIWFLLAGIYSALNFVMIPESVLQYIEKGILALIIFSITFTLASITSGIIKYYGVKLGITLQVTGLGQFLAKAAIISIGIIIILAELGIEITPLIASLGIGALAVALALQDTLSNVFAGFYVLADKPIRIGDYIMVEGAGEGYVIDIGWRSTKIRTLQNNVIVIPNKKLAGSVITNYYMPDKPVSVPISIAVSYNEDPERVEKILLDEALKASKEIPGMLDDPAPFVRFLPGPGEYSLNFTIICRAREYTDQFLIRHEMYKRIFRRLREEGIEIPFPIRTVYLKQGGERRKQRSRKAGTT
ncbi:MAG: mechanosensitive ion channel family protein [Nitrososphaerota archaeon]